MAKHIEDKVEYYYDSHPTEEDLMGESVLHRVLVQYLVELLQWLFFGQRCAIYANLNFYQTLEYLENPLAPDVAVIPGVEMQKVTSWTIGKTGPAPQVVFEIGSTSTWNKDLDEKPLQYAHMGVQEYFAYDPNTPLLRQKEGKRLYGWQLDPQRKRMREMTLNPDGTLWSTHLNSFLVPDGEDLRLYDQYGNRRLTQLEFEKRRAEALAEKLRSLGIDPNQI